MNGHEPNDPTVLLAHGEWLRRLALSLVRDEGLADDLCQEAMLATWRRESPVVGNLRAWLATVARRLAARWRARDAGRAEREQTAARAEAEPSSAETVERFRLQRRVGAAVEALEEPYRTTVLLRWFDGLPPRAIARRMQVPVETVRTRLKRARAELRARLDSESGSREAWALPLCGTAAHGSAAVSVLLGGFVMGTKTKLAVATAMLCVLALLARSWLRTGVLPPDATGLAAAARPAVESRPAPQGALAEREPLDGARPASAPAMAEPPTLLVEVVLKPRGSPTSGTRVTLYADDGRVSASISEHTDAAGRALFSRLRPGQYQVATDRGATALATVAQGTSTCRIEQEEGTSVDGRVRDWEGTPVAGATIALESVVMLSGGVMLVHDPNVAESDREGRFRIEGVPAENRQLVARKPGFAPSPRTAPHSRADRTAEVDLVLPARGAALEVLVHAGAVPLRGVLVRISLESSGGAYAFAQAPGSTLTTDERGRAFADTLPAGATSVFVRAPGHSWESQRCVLEGGSRAALDFDLAPAAVITGRVTDRESRPLRAAVLAKNSAGHASGCMCAADGSYRHDTAPPGRLVLTFSRPGYRNEVRVLDCPLGAVAEVPCDVVLAAESQLRGILLDEGHRPLAGWRVEAFAQSDDPTDHAVFHAGETDAKGRFACNAEPGVTYVLRVAEARSQVLLECQGAPPMTTASEEVVITLLDRERPNAFVAGRLADEAGEPVAGASVSALIGHGRLAAPSAVSDAAGKFRLGPLAPGEYGLDVRPGRSAVLAPADLPRLVLAPREEKDLGTLRLARGVRVAYRFVDPQGGEVGGVVGSIRRADTRASVAELPAGPAHGEVRLLPGRYVALVSGGRDWTESTEVPLEVVADRDSELELRVERAVWRSLRMRLPSVGGRTRMTMVHVTVQAPSGGVYECRRLLEPGDVFETRLSLTAGTNHIALRLPDGRAFEGKVEIADLVPAREVLEVVLKACR